MNDIISIILGKFSDPGVYFENIIDEMLALLVSNNFCDVGTYISFDTSCNRFWCGGIIPNSFENDNKEKINGELGKLINNISSPALPEQCGIYYYVAHKFFTNQLQDCYISLGNIPLSREENHILLKYYIDVRYSQKEILSEFVFPIYFNNLNGTNDTKTLHSIIILDSFQEKEHISTADIKTIGLIMNYIIQNNEDLAIDKRFITLINALSAEKRSKEKKTLLSIEDDLLFQELVRLYPFNVKSKEHQQVFHCRLKHASLWSFNNVQEGQEFLVKNKELNCNNVRIIGKDTRAAMGFETVPRPHHLFYNFMAKTYQTVLKNPGIPFYQLIGKFRFNSDLENQFYNYSRFKETNDLRTDDLIVLLPIVPHAIAESIAISELNMGMLALFFDKYSYSYYYNDTFLELLSHKIYENYRGTLHVIRREIRRSILNDITLILDAGNKFFDRALETIRDNVDFESAVLYFFNEERTVLNRKCISVTSLIEGLSEKIKLIWPESIRIDDSTKFIMKWGTDFLDFVSRHAKDRENTLHDFFFFWNDLTSPEEHDAIYSIMIIPICVSNNLTSGILVCINNYTNIAFSTGQNKPQQIPTYFSREECEISQIGAEVIATYSEILRYYKGSENVLHKLAHEIPNQTSYISAANRKLRKVIFQHITEESSEGFHILNLLNQMELSSQTIRLFTEYIHLKEISKEAIEKYRDRVDMKSFLTSMIELKNIEAMENGTFIEFILETNSKYDHVLYVHSFFKMIIINLLNNAIKYSYPGTTILVTCRSLTAFYFIEIENIGIHIRDEDKVKIFEDGYRTPEASQKHHLGNGTGLYLAKRIVETYHGKIELIECRKLASRNIFFIHELRRLAHLISNPDEFATYLNQKSRIQYPYNHYLHKYLTLDQNEKELLERMIEFRLDTTNLRGEVEGLYKNVDEHRKRKKGIIRELLDKRYKGNEDFQIISKNYLENSISKVKFQISFQRDYLNDKF
jgi:signal transduction histidine kinase